MNTKSDEAEAFAKIAQGLDFETRTMDANTLVLTALCDLAGVPGAVMLHDDPIQGLCYRVADHFDDACQTDIRCYLQALRNFSCKLPELIDENPNWQTYTRDSLQRHFDKSQCQPLSYRLLLRGHFKQKLRPSIIIAFFDTGLDIEATPWRKSIEEALAQSCQAVLNYALSILEYQLPAHIDYLSQKLQSASYYQQHIDYNVEQQQLKDQLLQILVKFTGADAAIIYLGDASIMQIAGVFPPCDHLLGLAMVKSSLTGEIFESKQSALLIEQFASSTSLQNTIKTPTLDIIEKAYGWSGVASWMCAPITDKTRCYGAIKLINSNDSCFFTYEQLRLLEVFSRDAFREYDRIRRQMMLLDLNRLVNGLAVCDGQTLGKQIIEQVADWACKFLKCNTSVAMYVCAESDIELFNRHSDTLSEAVGVQVAQISRQLMQASESCGEPIAVMKNKKICKLKVGTKKVSYSTLILPIGVAGDADLHGHMFFLNQDEFTAGDLSDAGEVARDVSILFHQENQRHRWRELSGAFRHTILGPVQGLASNAAVLGEIALEHAPEDENVEQYIAAITREEYAVRRWRDIQRLTGIGSKVELRLQRETLKPLLERCIKRFESVALDRHLRLRLDWVDAGSYQFSFDTLGLDVAISNLLDNALKYAFFNTEITAGARVSGAYIELWVEDLGHRIPKRLDDDIYKKGHRLDWQDPFRAISGEGLGLAITKAITDAHRGKLRHSCESHTGKSGETQPYKVRFTLSLPHHWG